MIAKGNSSYQLCIIRITTQVGYEHLSENSQLKARHQFRETVKYIHYDFSSSAAFVVIFVSRAMLMDNWCCKNPSFNAVSQNKWKVLCASHVKKKKKNTKNTWNNNKINNEIEIMYSASSLPNHNQFNNRPGGTPCSIGHKYQRMGLWASVIIRTIIFGLWPFSSLFLLQSVAFILQSLTFFFYPFGAYARKGKGSNT